ncbi:MAG: phytanoyl-CoA dioxygenase family protein [Lentisphaeria bacterium]|nr:phytanoyl-CoA dioxygenase family protein [Lentisphaeria bacterium]NQZ70002.1 phytanoyl-CoA dioxygenase family protein [Lentisphaeria bacterium]
MAMWNMGTITPFYQSNDDLENPEAIRKSAKENGYLFFKGLIDPDILKDLRTQVLAILQEMDFLDPDHPLTDGIIMPGKTLLDDTKETWQAFYWKVQKLQAFHAFSLYPPIIDVLEKLFDGSVLPHPRNILRAISPGIQSMTTPPHQDFWHIGGTPDCWTAWFPLGDCDKELGGLAIAKSSHHGGIREQEEGEGAGGTQVAGDIDYPWHSNEFECGDLVFFQSHSIHQGMDNNSPDRIRLSLDLRFQPRNHPVHSNSLKPHMGWINWDEVYEDWDKDDPLRYYWQNWDLAITENK